MTPIKKMKVVTRFILVCIQTFTPENFWLLGIGFGFGYTVEKKASKTLANAS
jgi:hypothetical protein